MENLITGSVQFSSAFAEPLVLKEDWTLDHTSTQFCKVSTRPATREATRAQSFW